MNRSQEPKPSFQVTDKRFWVHETETPAASTGSPERRFPSFVEELKERTELAERRLREKIEELGRENEAFRERLTRESRKRLERERNDLFCSLLEVIDNLERALEAAESGLRMTPQPSASDPTRLIEGVRLSLELFLSTLKRSGVEPIEVLNRPFDPHESEAVGYVEVGDPEQDQKVVEVLQKGYRCGEQVLRPARVRIGKLA